MDRLLGSPATELLVSRWVQAELVELAVNAASLVLRHCRLRTVQEVRVIPCDRNRRVAL